MDSNKLATIWFYWISYSHLPAFEIAKRADVTVNDVEKAVKLLGRFGNASR